MIDRTFGWLLIAIVVSEVAIFPQANVVQSRSQSLLSSISSDGKYLSSPFEVLAGPNSSNQTSPGKNRLLDDSFADVAVRIPEFGGLFLDGNVLKEYLTNPSLKNAAQSAVAEALGPWTSATGYPTGIIYQSCASSSGYIYCVGGSTSFAVTNDVYYASLSSSGVGLWTATTSYPTSILGQSCVASSGYIYCVGGYTGSGFTNAVYFASVSSSGIGKWTATTNYPTTVAYQSCVASSGYIYCVGSAVYYAPLSSTGVGAWSSTTTYPAGGFQDGSCVVSSGYIFCVNVFSNAFYYASLSNSGLGAWMATTNYPTGIGYESCVVSSGYMYCVGGTTGSVYENAVYYAPVSSTGIGAWAATASYPTNIYGHSCVVSSSYIYCVGGDTGVSLPLSIVYYAPVVENGASWSLLDGLSPDAPGLAASSTRLFMGARSTDNTIWYRGMDSTGAWSGWVNLPGLTDARPAVVVFNSGLYVFAKEAGTNNIWYGSLPLSGGVVSGSFSGWTWLNGPSPAAVGLATDGSYLYVAAEAPDGGIWIRRMATSGVWSGWTQVPGLTDVSPAIAVFNNQLYFVCKQRSTNNIWYGYVSVVSYPGGWSGWVLLPGPTPDALTLTVSSDHLYVAARGMDSSIWYRSMDSSGTWSSWSAVPGYTSSPIGVCVYSGSLWFAAREAGTNNLWITNRPL